MHILDDKLLDAYASKSKARAAKPDKRKREAPIPVATSKASSVTSGQMPLSVKPGLKVAIGSPVLSVATSVKQAADTSTLHHTPKSKESESKPNKSMLSTDESKITSSTKTQTSGFVKRIKEEASIPEAQEAPSSPSPDDEPRAKKTKSSKKGKAVLVVREGEADQRGETGVIGVIDVRRPKTSKSDAALPWETGLALEVQPSAWD